MNKLLSVLLKRERQKQKSPLSERASSGDERLLDLLAR